MSKWLTKGEAEYLKEDNEWHLVLLDIADLMRNCTGISDPKEYAARAIRFVLSHQEREAPTAPQDSGEPEKCKCLCHTLDYVKHEADELIDGATEYCCNAAVMRVAKLASDSPSESTAERTRDVPEPQAQGSGDGVDEALSACTVERRFDPITGETIDLISKSEAQAAIELLLLKSQLKLLDNLKPVGTWTEKDIEANIKALQSNLPHKKEQK